MIRLAKLHVAACRKTTETDWKCVPKKAGTRVSCPFYFRGSDPRGSDLPRIKKHTGTCDERIAKTYLLTFEAALYDTTPKPEPVEAPKTLDEALADYLETKTRVSDTRQDKLNLQLGRMVVYLKIQKYADGFADRTTGLAKAEALDAFNRLPADLKAVMKAPEGLESFNRLAVRDVKATDLQKYMNTWVGATSTLATTRENMKSFWRFCYDSEYVARNIAGKTLGTIPTLREQKERKISTLLPADGEAIINTALKAINGSPLFKREGRNAALQTLAFTYVEKYSGMAIGDVTRLRLDALDGTSLMVNRKKTGEPVYATIPDFAVAALHAFPPDSSEYFFWSGEGKLHTRVNKWGGRLQKLFAAAAVRVKEIEKKRRSGGKLKTKPEVVKVSIVTPHWWRHTFVRDCYLANLSIEMIADLLGDDVDTVREFYSCFDVLRQRKLKQVSASIWADDRLTQRLAADHASSVAHVQSTQRESATSA